MSPVSYSQPWFTSDCKKLVRNKKKLYQKVRKGKLGIDCAEYRNAVIQSRKTWWHAYNTFVRNYLNENSNFKSKCFYSYIKSKQIDTIGVSPLKSNGSVYIDSKDKARILSSLFVSVFSVGKGEIPTIHAKYVNCHYSKKTI